MDRINSNSAYAANIPIETNPKILFVFPLVKTATISMTVPAKKKMNGAPVYRIYSKAKLEIIPEIIPARLITQYADKRIESIAGTIEGITFTRRSEVATISKIDQIIFVRNPFIKSQRISEVKPAPYISNVVTKEEIA